MSDINFDKELTKQQYDSKEYKVGKHDGMWSMIGVVQREALKGKNIDEIIDKMFNIAEDFNSDN